MEKQYLEIEKIITQKLETPIKLQEDIGKKLEANVYQYKPESSIMVLVCSIEGEIGKYPIRFIISKTKDDKFSVFLSVQPTRFKDETIREKLLEYDKDWCKEIEGFLEENKINLFNK